MRHLKDDRRKGEKMATTPPLVEAAAYLRTSTEEQRYSLVKQREGLTRYAEKNGFVISRCYEDVGRSGIGIRGRKGLKRLLAEITARESATFKAVLVYDVSRWGRFQDCDEAAHYEFLCKQCGVTVHYCDEPFVNDGTAKSSIMKAVKRTMAGEFSRELGNRGYAGKKRAVLSGFRPGGPAGYGLRRVAVNADGKLSRRLQGGQRKPFSTDRVTLILGPKSEVDVVRQLFDRFTDGKGKVGPMDLAKWLNTRGIPSEDGSRWTCHKVSSMLSNPKYSGRLVWGRTTQRLSTPPKPQPESEWVTFKNAFEAIVSARQFAQAQRLLKQRSDRKIPEAKLVADLGRLLRTYGRLSESLIDSKGIHGTCTYRKRFGSLRRAYDLAGYRYPSDTFAYTAAGTKTCTIRDGVLLSLVSLFPEHLNAFRFRWATRRSQLLFNGSVKLYVWIARQYRSRRYGMRWKLIVPPRENDGLTLLCLLDGVNDKPESFYLFPALDLRCWRYSFGPGDALLSRGIKLTSLAQLRSVAEKTLIANAIPVPTLDLTGLRRPLLNNERSGNKRDHFPPRASHTATW